jgi:hypothetical protein
MKPTTATVKITVNIPAELKDQIPPEYNLTKFVIQAIREKLERDKK